MNLTKCWRPTNGGISGLIGVVELVGILVRWIFWRKKRAPKEASGGRQIIGVVTVRRKTDQFKGERCETDGNCLTENGCTGSLFEFVAKVRKRASCWARNF